MSSVGGDARQWQRWRDPNNNNNDRGCLIVIKGVIRQLGLWRVLYGNGKSGG